MIFQMKIFPSFCEIQNVLVCISVKVLTANNFDRFLFGFDIYMISKSSDGFFKLLLNI